MGLLFCGAAAISKEGCSFRRGLQFQQVWLFPFWFVIAVLYIGAFVVKSDVARELML